MKKLRLFPRNFQYSIYKFIQRGKRGFSDSDLNNFDSYLYKVLTEVMHRFAIMKKHGHPCYHSGEEDWTPEKCSNCDCLKKQLEILTEGWRLFYLLSKDEFDLNYSSKEYDKGYVDSEEIYSQAMKWLEDNLRSMWD